MARIHRSVQKSPNDADNHDDVVTHLELDMKLGKGFMGKSWSVKSSGL